MATANSALNTNFNVEPYYDDYAEDKNFHRILFKPGFAVQARELTQLQTILQDQVARHGYHIFKEGSEVSGGSQFLDTTTVARLQSSYAGSDISVSEFEGKYARGRQSENLYYVKKVVAADQNEFDLLHLQFIRPANTSSLNTTSFSGFANSSLLPISGEVFDFSNNNILTNGVFTSNTGAAQLIAGSPNFPASANGLMYHVDDSIYFTKGFFVKTGKQSISLGANTLVSKSIGFNVVEDTISSTSDSSLLDPASGSFNYTAPGADRFKLSLTLASRDLTDPSEPSLSSVNYFEIARVNKGQLVRKNTTSNYNNLGDVLAQRTFDESGHYSVNGMNVRVANTASNSEYLTVKVSPGKAYVKGYPVQTFGTLSIPMLRARDTDSVTEQNMTALYGNYVFANTFTTGLLDVDGKVDLHANTVPTPGDKIGEAYIKNIEYSSGTGDQRVYKVFLYDVKITNADLTFETMKSFRSLSGGSTAAQALVHSTGRTSIDKVGASTADSNQLIMNNTSGIRKGQLVENATHLPPRTTVSSVLFDTVTLSANALLSNTSTTFTFSSTDLKETGFHRAYFELPNKNVTGVTNIDYKFKRKFATVSFTSGAATIQTDSGAERFSSGAGSLVNENFIVVVKTGGTGSLSNGENVDLTTGSRTVTTPTPTPGSPASAVIDLDEAGFNGTCDIYAVIDVTADPRRVKTYANNNTRTLNGAATGINYSLGYADVFKINAIYEGNSSFVDANSTVVTSNFTFDNGQRDNFYDHATIQLKTGQANTTNQYLVDFNRYAASGGKGYFVADSYPNYDLIPVYTDQRGQEVYLRDVIDFRPIRSANTSANVYTSTNKSFENHQIVDSQTFNVELDYNYYLKRIHKLSVDENGNFLINSGISKLKNPPEPQDDPEKMTLATFRLNPYTYNERDMQVRINNNSRYTMKDIGDLDRRLKRVEYYTALNLLETQINNRQFTDDNGDVLFKNGFVVDAFSGHGIGDVFNPDYSVSIDRTKGILHPPFNSDSAPLVFSSGTATRVGDFITIPYTEVSYLSQNTASSFLNVNPFQIASYVGVAKLTPDTDIWVDFETTAEIVVNDDGDLDNYAHLQTQIGTDWGDWNVVSTTRTSNRKTTTKERTGTRTSVEVDEVLVKETKKILESVFYFFMRSKKVEFTLDGMRPNTRIYCFMDGINISGHMGPSTLSANTVEDVRYLAPSQKEVYTDENGSATGFFFVPNDSNITANPNANTALVPANQAVPKGLNIPVGTVPVLFTDSVFDTLKSTTYALTSYSAEGSKQSVETTRFMTKEYRLATTSVTDNKTLTTSTGSPSDTRESGVSTRSSTGVTIPLTPTEPYFADDDEGVFNDAADVAGWNDSNHGISTDVASTVVADWFKVNYDRKPGRYETELAIERYEDILIDNGGDVGAANLLLDTEAKNFVDNNNGAVCSEGSDPLAQTFFINEAFYPKGIFITSVDMFFRTKDDSLPVRVEIRPTENGFPSALNIIPFSQVVKKPSEINIPSNTNSPVPTNFAFDNPIHLPPGEYSIVVLTDSFDYTVYRSVIGEAKLGTSDFITEQPTLGSLFKSQNARTWTPAQDEDLCFRLYKAEFTTGTNYTATLTANNIGRASYDASSNTVGKFDMTQVVLPEYSDDVAFDVDYKISTKIDGGAVGSFISVPVNEEVFFTTPQEITTGSDYRLQVTMLTRNPHIAPYFDVSAAGGTLVKNRINASAGDIPETSASGGGAIARYITRKVTLAEGFDATSLRVLLDQNMPAGSSVEVYYKVINNNDDTQFNDRAYVQMTRVQTDTVNNEELDEFTEYEYTAEGITYTEGSASFNAFNQFAIKIVLFSSSSAAAPTCRNLRAIAFS